MHWMIKKSACTWISSIQKSTWLQPTSQERVTCPSSFISGPVKTGGVDLLVLQALILLYRYVCRFLSSCSVSKKQRHFKKQSELMNHQTTEVTGLKLGDFGNISCWMSDLINLFSKHYSRLSPARLNRHQKMNKAYRKWGKSDVNSEKPTIFSHLVRLSQSGLNRGSDDYNRQIRRTCGTCS